MPDDIEFASHEPVRPIAFGDNVTGDVVAAAVAGLLLTLLSVFVVLAGASQEPYFGKIRPAHALTQVGLAGALVGLWGAWSAAVIVLVGRGRVAAPWLLSLIVAAAATFYLVDGAVGYVDDIVQFQRMSAPTTGNAAASPSGRNSSGRR